MSANFINNAKVRAINPNQLFIFKQTVAIPNKAAWLSIPVAIAVKSNPYSPVKRRTRVKSAVKQLRQRIELVSKELSLRLYSMDKELRNRARAALIYLNLNNYATLSPIVATSISAGDGIDKLIELIEQTPKGEAIFQVVREYSQH